MADMERTALEPTGLLFEALASPNAAHSAVRFIPGDGRCWTGRDFDEASREVAAWLRRRIGTGNSLAAVLASSFDSLAVVLGALRSGVRLVSLPYPARGATWAEYRSQITQMCSLTEAVALVVDHRYKPFTEAIGIPVYCFEECRKGVGDGGGDMPGGFVQFSSGSTSWPKGIELSLGAVESNLVAMMDIYRPGAYETACSWLPLSHDMGLFGMCGMALAASHPRWSTVGQLVLIDPLHFLADPRVWLQTCSEYRASFTAVPPSALGLVTRTLRPGRSLDLSALRALVVGSEPVRAELLRRFATAAERFGMNRRALCPAYGLGEATLGVTAVRAGEEWTVATVHAGELGQARWVEHDSGQEIVSCGRPLPGVEVRVRDGDSLGRLELRSPGLLSGYVGDGDLPMTPDGWFGTTDIGHIGGNGEVYVIGRADDVCFVAGRNVYLHDLDPVIEAHPLVRPGGGVAIAGPTGSVVVVAECRRPALGTEDLLAACREIRAEVVSRCSVRPSVVLLTRPGMVPRTPSGKIRRRQLSASYAADDVPILVSV